MGLLPLAGRGIQPAEAAVAVGLERAQAEGVGQGTGLAVVGSATAASGGSRCVAISPRSRRAYASVPRSRRSQASASTGGGKELCSCVLHMNSIM